MPDAFGNLTEQEKWAAAVRSGAASPAPNTAMGGATQGSLTLEELAELAQASQSNAGEKAQLANQMKMANALRGKQLGEGKTVGSGRYQTYMGNNWGDVANVVGQNLIGGLETRRAREGLEDLDAAESETALAQAMAAKRQEKADAELAALQRAEDLAIGERNEEARVTAATVAEERRAAAAKLARENTAEQNRLDRENQIKKEEIKARDDESGYWTPKTAKERETFDAGGTKAASTQALLASYDDSYSAPEAVRAVPGGAAITDWYNRTLGDEEGTESAQWWSDKERRELKPRHELFGSAFTAPEKKAYDATTFSKSDSPEFIRGQLQERLRLEKVATEEMAAKYLMNGANPETIMMNFGDTVDVDQLVKDMESGVFQEKVRARKEAARDGIVLGATDGKDSESSTKDSTDSIPAGIDPEDWKYMSDDEKALFR